MSSPMNERFCTRAFSRRDIWQCHMSTHDRSGYAKCLGCGKSFRSDYLSYYLKAKTNSRCRSGYTHSIGSHVATLAPTTPSLTDLQENLAATAVQSQNTSSNLWSKEPLRISDRKSPRSKIELREWEELTTRCMQPRPTRSSIERQVRRLVQGRRPVVKLVDNTKRWRCELCHIAPFDSFDIENHAKGHAYKPPEPLIQCSKCDIDFLYDTDYQLHRSTQCESETATNQSSLSECDFLMAGCGDDWIESAIRAKFVGDLRVWERFQLYGYLDKSYEFLQSRVQKADRKSSMSPTAQSLPSLEPSSVFKRGSYIAKQSCSTYTRFTERMDATVLMERFALLGFEDHKSCTNVTTGKASHVCDD